MPAHILELDAAAGAPRPTGTVTFIGNATVIIEVAGFRIMTDPNFLHQGDHAKLGGGLRSKRVKGPASALVDLLPIDLVVLSHHHGDHWDEVADRDMPKDVPVVTTAHAAKKLAKQGFRRTYPLDTWEQAEVRRADARLTITSVPAKHAPQPLQTLLPPTMGSVLDFDLGGRRFRLYITGDTLLFDQLGEIPRRYPGIDLALVHLGGTRVLSVMLTMNGEQGARAMEIIDPETVIPIHFDDYTVFTSPVSDFEKEMAGRGLRTKVHRLERGDSFDFPLSGTSGA